MVTGDEATCREANRFLGDKIVTVSVKKGLGREAAILYPFEETRKVLYEGAKRAVISLASCKPYKLKTPIYIKEQWLNLDPSLPNPQIVVRECAAKSAIEIWTWFNK